MDANEGRTGERDDVRPRCKQGVGTSLPGPRLSISLSLMRKQLVELDRLAVEIRAGGGVWITRSGIISAIVEAACQPVPACEAGRTANEGEEG
jgi:hypothetical protein